MITIDFFKKMLGVDTSNSASIGPAQANNSSENINTSNEQLKTTEQMNNSSNNIKKARIYNLIIVDESGSMGHLTQVTIDGVNETINSIRGAQRQFKATQEHFLTLVTFDSNGSNRPVRTLINRAPIAQVNDFTNYSPYGSTPLYDAMGQSITALHNHIKDDEDATAVVTVLTDGYENSSTEWNGPALKALIEQLTRQGWSFSYMGSAHDVKQVSLNLSINNVIEFSHDAVGASSTWARENSAKQNYYRKMDEEYRNGRRQSKEEWLERKRQMAKEYYGQRVTPRHINDLREGEIFVFGSNHTGNHGGGAARVALNNFGAVNGQAEGLQGRSYAIPSTGSLEQMREAVQRFTEFASQHPELRFLVTRVGCGIAGKSVTDVASLFSHCINLENVSLPIDFWKILGLKMDI